VCVMLMYMLPDVMCTMHFARPVHACITPPSRPFFSQLLHRAHLSWHPVGHTLRAARVHMQANKGEVPKLQQRQERRAREAHAAAMKAAAAGQEVPVSAELSPILSSSTLNHVYLLLFRVVIVAIMSTASKLGVV
jgi:hypothetical protein